MSRIPLPARQTQRCFLSGHRTACHLCLDEAGGQRALGDATRLARTNRGLTQIEHADSPGMQRTQLEHVEQGKKDCQLSTLMRLADAWGLPLSMLVRSAQV
ncbi:XRE family transcriptional regulator [Xanthomonas gardneri]|nr:hypothetical protein BJD10_15910 [Xanthomonas hortorum pv. gardneri]NMI50072.1 XRE family transcriptional regulator [Xanthomonas hortorum pv. gardneri]